MSRVLIIEDDDEMRGLIVEVLGGEGYEVSSATDGAKGLAEAAVMLPDLILCDIVMPGLSGYDVLRTLRREPLTAVTPVIFLTGMGGPEALRAGMNLGADDYLVKPVQPTVLVAAVAARLGRSEAVRREAERCLQGLKDELARSLLPHEFLTPLTAVMGLASLLEEGAISARDTREAGRGILEASQMLESLIGKFLAYAELHAAIPAATPGLDAERAFETAREEAMHRAQRANRSGDLHVWGEPARVAMTVDHWRLLVGELVDNAFKFSRAGSQVALGLTGRNGEPTLSVRDHGQGMSAEYRDGLEQRAPFLRRHQDQAGLGLGLSLVRRLLHLYGGTLSFETAAGEGTTARVRFLPQGATTG
jgi:CheY-like chemotaxis protein/two-component sensor histidine kinase